MLKQLTEKFGLSALIAVLIGVSSFSIVGCDSDDDNGAQVQPAPGNNLGLIPLNLGNRWTFQVSYERFNCENHPLFGCQFNACVEDCEDVRRQEIGLCQDEFQRCFNAANNSIQRNLCEAALEVCLDGIDEDFRVCAAKCEPLLEPGDQALCDLGTCFIANGGVADCDGTPVQYSGCPVEVVNSSFTDAVQSVRVLDGQEYYAYSSQNFYYINGPDGLMNRGNPSTREYPEGILEFKYPAVPGDTYLVNYPDRGAYIAVVVGTNIAIPADDVPAAAQNGGDFLTYHYRLIRQDENDCGCFEQWDYWIAPGVGIVKAEAEFASTRNGEFTRNYSYELVNYTVEPPQ